MLHVQKILKAFSRGLPEEIELCGREAATSRWKALHLVVGAFRHVMEGRKQRMIPRKLYKIGEIMRYTGLSRQTIHNYTTLGLLTEEERTESGHRLYGEDVFARIERIKELRQRNTLREIIKILKQESPGNPVSPA